MTDDKLEAGRELDALIAERVIGWEVLHVGYVGTEDESTRQRELSDWLDALDVQSVGDYYIDVSKNFIVGVEDWQPSSDIKAAWAVLLKLKELFQDVAVSSSPDVNPPNWWECAIEDISRDKLLAFAVAPDAPLAICRAALKACKE